MTTPGFCLFDTAIGACAVAWSERGLTGVQLPEADADEGPSADGAALLRTLWRPTLPAEVREAIDAITALTAGEARDLASIRLDMEGLETLPRGVYEIPPAPSRPARP